MWDLKGILVGVDFSEPSKGALRYACELAKQTRSRLDVLYVLKNPSGVFMPSSPTMFKLGEADLEKAKEKLNELVHSMPAELPESSVHVALGRPDETIVSQAKELGAGLIVLGARGRGFLLPLGSVAERVIRSAPCPVIAHKELPSE